MGFRSLALRCPLAQFHSWRTEPTSAKVRKYQLMHTYLTSRHRCTIAKFCFLDGILAANDCALLVFTVMVTLRLLAVEISPTCAICRNFMLIHNSSPYNHEWWPIFE